MKDRPHGTPPDTPGFDRWLRETMASESGPVPSECLDPETLAAWAEGALSGSERSFAEAHAARCARCQAMLAVMAKTVPPDTVSPRPSFRKWLMVLTPAAAAATAVALWFSVEPGPRDAIVPLPQPSSTIARDDRIAPPAPASPAASSPSANGAPVSADKDSPRREVLARPLDRQSEQKADPRSAATQGPPSLSDEVKTLEKRKEIDANRPAPPAGPPPPAAQPTATPTTTGDRLRTGALAETVVVQPKPRSGQEQIAQAEETRQRQQSAQQTAQPAPQQTVQSGLPPAAPAPPRPVQTQTEPKAAAPASGERAAADTADKPRIDAFVRDGRAVGGVGGRGGSQPAENESQFRANVLAQPTVVAPDTRTRWRISARLLQQSLDGGATWSTQFTLDEGMVLVSGAAPSSSVCWFVGASGAVVTTSDGRTWRRIVFPVQINLIGITSVDARNAAVVASDQRVFVTTNGGETWVVRKEP